MSADLDYLHVKPNDDLLGHTWEDCACLPHLVPVELDDGSFTYMYVHNAWDGRD